MKNNWPEYIDLQFKTSGNVVSGILVIVLLLSKAKNNFPIGPLLVNEDGILSLRSTDLRESIRREKIEYPMDYDGELDDCSGFEVLVESEEDLLERINRLRIYYPAAAANLERLVKDSHNRKFSTFRRCWQLPIRREKIVIELKEL